MIRVKFSLPGGEKVIDASAGLSILEAALAQGVPLQYGCREGRCGRCGVAVAGPAGVLAPPGQVETKKLGKRRIKAGQRLACQAQITAAAGAAAVREGAGGAGREAAGGDGLVISQAPVSPDTDPEELARSFDATFQVGREALAYLRRGLNAETAQDIAEVIHKISQVDAVAVTDTERILGFTGVGCYYHYTGRPILTEATKSAIATGQFASIVGARDLRCPVEGCPCPLKAAVIAPLKCRDRVVGTVKLYLTRSAEVPPFLTRLAMGISELLSMQIELAEADRQMQLVTKARLEALQAQIRPHFLFNILNTIIMFTRTDVETCRDLLIQLASFFRRSLNFRGNFITVQEEIEYINTYLRLEQARFGEKIRMRMKIDPRVYRYRIPILTIQPLVENAIVHGLAPKEGVGRLSVAARLAGDELHLLVRDNGVGIPPERVEKILLAGYGSGMGLGLSNVNDRLVSLYGEKYRLKIRSVPGRGTTVLVRVPLAGPLALGEPATIEVRAAAGAGDVRAAGGGGS